MAQFENYIKIAKEMLMNRYGEPKLDNLADVMRDNFERIIPEIPYIGGNKNPWTALLVGGAFICAMNRTLENEGLSYRDIGEFIYNHNELINKARVQKLEKAGLKHADQLFIPEYVDNLKKMAQYSQKKEFPLDCIFEFVDGEGKPFDYGMNFSQCAVHELTKILRLEKYMPFICLMDICEANISGFGFTRTQTLGSGAPGCDHRYIKGGSTPRAWPPDKVQEFKAQL